MHYEAKAKLYKIIAVKRKFIYFTSITGSLDNTDGVNKYLLKFTLAECLNINLTSPRSGECNKNTEMQITMYLIKLNDGQHTVTGYCHTIAELIVQPLWLAC